MSTRRSSIRRSSSTRRGSSSSKRSTSSFRRGSIEKLRHKSDAGVPDKPWRELTAMRKSDRLAMPRHCFLDQANRKYPVCFLGSTQTSCIGLQAAKKRASIQGDRNIVRLAEQREKHFGCNSESGKWRTREHRIYAESKKKRSSSTKRR